MSLLVSGRYFVLGVHWNFCCVSKLDISTDLEPRPVAQVCRHWYWPDRNLSHGSPPRPGCINCWRCILTLQFLFPLYFHHATCRCSLITDVRQENSETAHFLLYQVPPCLLWRKALFCLFTPSLHGNKYPVTFLLKYGIVHLQNGSKSKWSSLLPSQNTVKVNFLCNIAVLKQNFIIITVRSPTRP